MLQNLMLNIYPNGVPLILEVYIFKPQKHLTKLTLISFQVNVPHHL